MWFFREHFAHTERMSDPNATSSSEGITDYLRGLLLATLSYLRARLELAGLEGKEAFTQLASVLVLAILAIALTVAGYLLLCIALVFGIAQFFHSPTAWIWISAIVGIAHAVGAWILIRTARAMLNKPMFSSTLEEFRKDETWLKSTAAKQR